jgi:hypothetical protein
VHPLCQRAPTEPNARLLQPVMVARERESSRTGELPPDALTEPCVNLAAHTALIVQPVRTLSHLPNAQRVQENGEPRRPTIPLLFAYAL